MREGLDLYPVPSWRGTVVNTNLPAHVKHVALTLSLHMNERGGSCFPSLKLLEAETSRGRATVVDALKGLEAAGFLRVERGGGRGSPNRYEAMIPGKGSLADPLPVKGSEKVNKGSASDTGGRPGGRIEEQCPQCGLEPKKKTLAEHLFDVHGVEAA